MPINAANNTHIHFRNPSLVMSPDAPIRAWLGRSQDPRLIELPVCPSVQLDARHRPFDLSPAPTPLEHEVLLLHMVPYSHFEGGTNFLVVPVVRHFRFVCPRNLPTKFIRLSQLIHRIDVKRRNWATRWPASDVISPFGETALDSPNGS